MTPSRLPARGALLLVALALAGCAGPLPDETTPPEAGYDSQTGRPPPAAPNEDVFPEPLPTPIEPSLPPSGGGDTGLP